VKYGVKPLEFVDMSENEKATVIAFIKHHAKDEKAAIDRAKEG
jgi:hypothetical protein